MTTVQMFVTDEGAKRIDEMSREELLVVITEMGRELEYYRAPGMAQAIGIGKAEMLRHNIPKRGWEGA